MVGSLGNSNLPDALEEKHFSLAYDSRLTILMQGDGDKIAVTSSILLKSL
jgi:hypothetical protein